MIRIKHFFQQSWLLIVASFAFGLLIAVANARWSDEIEWNKTEKLNRLSSALLPEARLELYAEVEIELDKGKKRKVKLREAVSRAGDRLGWTFEAAGSGFQDKIELVIALDKDLKTIVGYKVLSCNETPGFGDQIKDKYLREQFKDAPIGKFKPVKRGEADPEKTDSEIVTITGATVSSEAVVKIFNVYVEKVKGKIEELVQKKKGQISDDKEG